MRSRSYLSRRAGVEGDTIKRARLALGGVAHKPWRDPSAEAALCGKAADQSTFTPRCRPHPARRQGLEHNAFKIGLARRVILRALTQAEAGTPSRSPIENPVSRSRPMTTKIGTPHPRRWPRQGHRAAKYAGEFNTTGLAHASLVTSTSPRAASRASTRARPLPCRRD